MFSKTFLVFCNSFPCGFLFSSRLWHWSLESKKVYFLMRKELKACPASDIGRIKRFQNTFFKFLSDRSDVWSLQGEKVYRLIPRDIGHRPLLAILLPPKGSRKKANAQTDNNFDKSERTEHMKLDSSELLNKCPLCHLCHWIKNQYYNSMRFN